MQISLTASLARLQPHKPALKKCASIVSNQSATMWKLYLNNQPNTEINADDHYTTTSNEIRLTTIILQKEKEKIILSNAVHTIKKYSRFTLTEATIQHANIHTIPMRGLALERQRWTLKRSKFLVEHKSRTRIENWNWWSNSHWKQVISCVDCTVTENCDFRWAVNLRVWVALTRPRRFRHNATGCKLSITIPVREFA